MFPGTSRETIPKPGWLGQLTLLSDDTLQFNPAVINSLVELMLGGHTPTFGETLHVRLRYFDPDRGRAGIPEDVGALIESLKDDEVVVNLVNTSPVNPRTLIVQAGAYAEHQITSATSDAGGIDKEKE